MDMIQTVVETGFLGRTLPQELRLLACGHWLSSGAGCSCLWGGALLPWRSLHLFPSHSEGALGNSSQDQTEGGCWETERWGGGSLGGRCSLERRGGERGGEGLPPPPQQDPRPLKPSPSHTSLLPEEHSRPVCPLGCFSKRLLLSVLILSVSTGGPGSPRQTCSARGQAPWPSRDSRSP